jgi:hypothetical protein
MATVKTGLLLGAVGLIAIATLKPAEADDLPIEVQAEIPRGAAIARWDGLYSWVEASRQSVDLSQLNLAQSLPSQIIAPSWAPTRSTDPLTTGYGVRGAIGFVIPNGTFSKFNSDLRVQLVTSYVGARSADSVASESLLSDPANRSCECNAVSNSVTSGMLATTYQSWQSELKAASDLNFGRFVVSPSISLFGKDARSNQSNFQGSAGSSWTDWGATFGFDATLDITSRAMVGFRASAGTAYRVASFSQGGALQEDGASFGSSSATVANAIGRPLLAGSEVNLIWKPQTWQTVKAFAGVHLDSRVPNAPDPLSFDTGSSNAITFQAVQNYYFGGSLKMEFGSDRAMH